MTPCKELTGEKREKFKKWLKQFQKENDRSPTIEEVYDETTRELDKKLSQAEADYDKMFWQKNEIISKAKEIITALLNVFVYDLADDEIDSGQNDVKTKAEQFLSEVEK